MHENIALVVLSTPCVMEVYRCSLLPLVCRRPTTRHGHQFCYCAVTSHGCLLLVSFEWPLDTMPLLFHLSLDICSLSLSLSHHSILTPLFTSKQLHFTIRLSTPLPGLSPIGVFFLSNSLGLSLSQPSCFSFVLVKKNMYYVTLLLRTCLISPLQPFNHVLLRGSSVIHLEKLRCLSQYLVE